MTENPALAAMEAYMRTHPHRADEVEEAMASFDPDSEVADDHQPVGVPAPAEAASEQLDLGTVARDEALARVEANADQSLVAEYTRLAAQLARTRPEFTTDDLEEAAERADLPLPAEKRIFGPIMLGLSKRKMIERTDRTVLSIRPSNHRRPIRVWRSVAYYEQR